MIVFYHFPHTAWARYNFVGDRLTSTIARKASALDVLYDEIPIGASRERVRRSFGATRATSFEYRPEGHPYDFISFTAGKVLYVDEDSNSGRAGIKVGMTTEQVIAIRGKPVWTCDAYDAPEGFYILSFCYDGHERLVKKETAAKPIP